MIRRLFRYTLMLSAVLILVVDAWATDCCYCCCPPTPVRRRQLVRKPSVHRKPVVVVRRVQSKPVRRTAPIIKRKSVGKAQVRRVSAPVRRAKPVPVRRPVIRAVPTSEQVRQLAQQFSAQRGVVDNNSHSIQERIVAVDNMLQLLSTRLLSIILLNRVNRAVYKPIFYNGVVIGGSASQLGQQCGALINQLVQKKNTLEAQHLKSLQDELDRVCIDNTRLSTQLRNRGAMGVRGNMILPL